MKNKLYLLILFLTTMSNLFAGSFINKTMVYGGSTRKYVIYVPTIYTTQNIKVPLLVGLHGNGDVASNFSQICMSSINHQCMAFRRRCIRCRSKQCSR